MNSSEQNHNTHGATYEEARLKNARDVSLFTQKWTHPVETAKGIVLIVHGYGHHGPVPTDPHDGWKGLLEALLQSKISVFAFDQSNFGRSEGLRAFVKNFDFLIEDIVLYVNHIKNTYSNTLPFFLYGESMGGAESIIVSQRHPELFEGVVLLAPMCKIADEVKPPSWQIPILRRLAKWFPRSAVIKSNVLDKCFSVPEELERARKNPLAYHGDVRLCTANQLYEATIHIENTLDTVNFPFLVLHGSADMVTSPKISQELHTRAASKDKAIRMYEGMWHALRSEPNAQTVLSDVVEWLLARCNTNTDTNTDNTIQLTQEEQKQAEQ